MKTYDLTIDGQTYRVEIDDLDAAPISVRVDGQPFAVTRAQAQAAAPQPQASVPATAAPVPVRAAAPAPRPAAAQSGAKSIIAPMPGTILEVKVRAGDIVAYGDEIGVLEAMKMESMLRAERAGTISEVHVNAGQSVSYGDALVTFA
jgi:glutaconyl-CoA/methylmalonyl-CoA decarboxylase subunit gamma